MAFARAMTDASVMSLHPGTFSDSSCAQCLASALMATLEMPVSHAVRDRIPGQAVARAVMDASVMNSLNTYSDSRCAHLPSAAKAVSVMSLHLRTFRERIPGQPFASVKSGRVGQKWAEGQDQRLLLHAVCGQCVDRRIGQSIAPGRIHRPDLRNSLDQLDDECIR
jgi:hypothetical protein